MFVKLIKVLFFHCWFSLNATIVTVALASPATIAAVVGTFSVTVPIAWSASVFCTMNMKVLSAPGPTVALFTCWKPAVPKK